MIETFRGIFERHGFEPIDTPALEYLEVLTGKAGENEKLMYQFADAGGRDVGLRYDLTVPLARFAAVHESEIVFPFKRYHIAPVWRAEKPQRGRFREFWQCDADIVGSSSMVADAEGVSIMAEALTAVGLPNFVIHISHRKLLHGLALAAGADAALAGTVYRSVDKLAKIGTAGVRAELSAGGVEADVADRIVDSVVSSVPGDHQVRDLRDRLQGVPEGLAAIEELGQLLSLLEPLGVPADRFVLDVSLARGLDYYTGPVYEALVEQPKVGSVAGAGRYDGLVGSMLGRPMPATGMSLGLERIIEVVQEFGLLPRRETVADVFVAVFPTTVRESAGLARGLRAAGLNVDFSLQSQRGLGEQLKYAGRRFISLAVIAGETEFANGHAAVKDLVTGAQVNIDLADLADRLVGQVSEGRSLFA
ncbi:MAG: histidine--tRNA ligase [Thermomicrobiales bacterium]